MLPLGVPVSDPTPSPDLRLDPANANKGTVRGLGMVERSLQQYGAGRSILATRDGVVIAGNKTLSRAIELGIPVREIESDGRTLYVIRRTDLTYDDPRARELAIADNRAAELDLAWSPEVLAALADDGVDLSQFWFEDELSALLESAADDILHSADMDNDADGYREQYGVIVVCESEGHQQRVFEELQAAGHNVRVVVT